MHPGVFPSHTRICWYFVALTALISTPFYFLYFHASRPATGTYIEYLMWCPAFAAFITLRISRMHLDSLGWKWPATRYIAIAAAVPALYMLTSYAILWSAGWGGFDWDFIRKTSEQYVWSRLPLFFTIPLYLATVGLSGTLNGAVSASGEEIGWRGLLAPQLTERFGYFRASLIGGLVWAFWHYPLFFRGSPKFHDLIFPMACFAASIGGAGFFATWLRMRSDSLWPPVVFHACHNAFLGMMTRMTVSSSKTDRYADETGLLLATWGVIMAIFFTWLEWKRSREIPEGPQLK